MPQFYCFHCGQHIDAHADLAGWEADCPACGGTITVPGAPRPDPEPELVMEFVPIPEAPSITEPVPVPMAGEKRVAEPETPPPVVVAKVAQPAAPESSKVAALAMAFAPPVTVPSPSLVEAVIDKPAPESLHVVSDEARPMNKVGPASPASTSVPEAPVSEAVVAPVAFATLSTVPLSPSVAYVLEASAPSPPPVAEKAVELAPEPPGVMPAEAVATNETAPALPDSPSDSTTSPPAVSLPEAASTSEMSGPTPTSTEAPTPKPQWEPSRKYVRFEKYTEPPAPLTTIPSTVVFMVWMFGGALAQVGLMLGAGQGSVIRERCQDSLLFMLTSSLVILAVVGVVGFLISMPIAAARKRAVGVFGSSFCIAVLAFGLFVLGSGALWYRSGWPGLAPSLNYVLAPFKDRAPAKAHAASTKKD